VNTWGGLGAGLYDYRNRIYSTVHGRFLQPDPIGFGHDVTIKQDGGWEMSQKVHKLIIRIEDVNFYRYVRNGILSKKDSYGLIGDWISGAFTGACYIGAFQLAKFVGFNPNDKAWHCITSCEVAKSSNSKVAESLGDLREACQTKSGASTEDSQSDQEANKAGRDCANDADCVICCCKKGYK
ncbi:MAG: hypothetical protein NZM04_11130, partial [Methylacidiphilales bacterium]|nr:hypothetical protein [Candidatus Methylacidiphilales bacterium]